MSKAKEQLGGKLLLGGLGLLLGSMLVYVLAVDRSWYAVDGTTRLAAESTGLVRWRFLSHVLGLANGGMRGQSLAFLVFPVMFWAALVLVIVGCVLIRRATRGIARPYWALERLRGRHSVAIAVRQRSFTAVKVLLGAACLVVVTAVAISLSAPPAEALTKAQLNAGNWRMRLNQMHDGQQLLVTERIRDYVVFGDIVSAEEASAFIRQEAASRARADADARLSCSSARNPDDCYLMRYSRLPREWEALARTDVATHTGATEDEWRAAIARLDRATILAVALFGIFLVLLGIATLIAPQVVASEFRGFDPEVEDALYSRYTRLGRLTCAASVIVVIVGIGAAKGNRPEGVSIGVVACTIAGALMLLRIGWIMTSARVLAHVRNPQLAAGTAVATHDRAVQVEVAKLEMQAAAKQQYATTLQMASSPPDLVSAAQAEAQQLRESVQREQSRLLGSALREALTYHRAAIQQAHALRAQNAPADAFAAVNSTLQASAAEIARLASVAGWVPWPLQESEAGPPASASERSAMSRLTIAAVGAGVAIVASIAALSRPHGLPGHIGGDQAVASASERTAQGVQQRSAPDACDALLEQYEHALSAAGESATNLPQLGCATEESGALVPVAQLTQQCQTLWTEHLANAQHAVELNRQVRSACPDTKVASMGAVPPFLRIDPKSLDPRSASQPTAPSPEIVEAPVRRQLTPVGLPFSVAIPPSAQVSPRDSGKGPTRHADIDPAGLGVDLIEWDTGPEACKPDVPIPGTHTEQNDYRTSDRTSILYYKHDADGDYGGRICNGTVGYVCIFDHVPQARGAAALAVCLSPERIGTTMAAPPTPTTSVASATPSRPSCTIAALNCAQFSTHGQTGKKLHTLVFAAEQAGRHAEAICLAQSNLKATDKWLAGAANFDSARAWDGLGCHDQAVAAIEASLVVRPRDQGGWKETCEQCRKIGGTCAPCDDNSASQAGSNSTTAAVGASNPVENAASASPVWVSLVQDPPRVFEVWESGAKVTEGPGAIQVVPGHPRTIVIKSRGWKDKTLVVDGKADRVQFNLELAPDCNATLADPKDAECRAQYCANHKEDPKCGLE